MQLSGFVSSVRSTAYIPSGNTESFSAHITANRRAIPILTYHHLSQTPPRGAGYRELYVAPNNFNRQMNLLKQLGYQGLSMSAIQPYLNGEKHGRVAGITFDDGYRNTFEHALPILSDLGFSSTCYFVSSLVGGINSWDQTIGLETAPLMNVAQMREWATAGQEVGAHTRHHVRLNKVDDATAWAEIALSKSDLEQIIQAPVPHFCYPYGAFAQQHSVMARDAGFMTATTTHRGRCHSGKNMMALPRVSISGGDGITSFIFKVFTPLENRPYAPARLRRLMDPGGIV